jgi:tetratricopeptide (TPR) repeat protein
MALAQSAKTFLVRGEIANFPAGDTIGVELRPVNHNGPLVRELAHNDGSVEIHNVEAGTYEVNVISSRGFSLRREIVQLDSFSNRLTVHLPKAPPAAGAGTISMKRLAFRPSKEARKLYRKAQSEAGRKRIREAIALLHQAVDMEPEWAEAYNNLGVQYYRIADVSNAFRAMAKAHEIDSDSPEIGSNYAVVLIPMNRAPEAETLIRRIMLRNGETPKGRFVLGMALAAQGTKMDEARALLTEVSEQFPSAKTFLSRLH